MESDGSPVVSPRVPSSERVGRVRAHFDARAPELDGWRRRNRYYHAQQIEHVRRFVAEGCRVLEVGCGRGDLLAALKPSEGWGVDLSPALITMAQARHPRLHFVTADAQALAGLPTQPFDYIVLTDLVGLLDDVQSCLEGLHAYCGPQTRIVISYHNFMWQPILAAAEVLRLKMPTPEQNWLSPDDLQNLLGLADFEVVKAERWLLLPKYLPVLSALVNGLGALPVVNLACLTHYLVARPLPRPQLRSLSVSVVVPTRNEKGNIEPLLRRLPAMGEHVEVIFVDGHSNDGTADEIRRVIAAYPDRSLHLLTQDGVGKGDAVRKGFEAARGDVLMILDADMTVPPEDLLKFYRAIATDKAEFLNGSRLVYPMEKEAMRTLNLLANKLFALAFSWLLGQRIKDTLCGTKVIARAHYRRLAANRGYFGDFDPFGDFDLLFGASRQALRIQDVPVRYHERRYGVSQISRFRHGWLLLRMVIFAARKLKWS